MKKEDKVKHADCDMPLCFNGGGIYNFETPECKVCKYNKNINGTVDNWYTAGRM